MKITDIKDLEGSLESGKKALLEMAIRNLNIACNGKPFKQTLWKRKDGKGKVERISKREGVYLYLKWDALGAYPPPGMSRRVSIGEFLKDYELLA
jgi:hypothetical protein